jgi:hypothetical protein
MTIHKTTKHLTFVKEDDAITVTSNGQQEVLGQIRFADRYNTYHFLMTGNNSCVSKSDWKEIEEVMEELNNKLNNNH